MKYNYQNFKKITSDDLIGALQLFGGLYLFFLILFLFATDNPISIVAPQVAIGFAIIIGLSIVFALLQDLFNYIKIKF